LKVIEKFPCGCTFKTSLSFFLQLEQGETDNLNVFFMTSVQHQQIHNSPEICQLMQELHERKLCVWDHFWGIFCFKIFGTVTFQNPAYFELLGVPAT